MRKFQPRILGKNKKKQGGFTLIELVIVIIIAGILGAAIVATYVDLTDEAEEANIAQSVAGINTGIALYIAENNGTAPVLGTADVENLVSTLQATGALSPSNGTGFSGDAITVGDTTETLTTTTCDGVANTICNVARP